MLDHKQKLRKLKYELVCLGSNKKPDSSVDSLMPNSSHSSSNGDSNGNELEEKKRSSKKTYPLNQPNNFGKNDHPDSGDSWASDTD